ncbi:MAG TPA: NAD(P)H-dependent oxidoreductase subunit E [Micromonosporaceae bacterium]|jgi:formate dehydrogenase subunit gamma
MVADQAPATRRARTDVVRAIATARMTDRGPLMPILHDVMAEFGYIERDDVIAIADVLNLSIADVHGVVSFYTDFRTTAPPDHTVALCRGEACQAVGAEALYAAARAAAATGDYGPGTEVEQVFCYGNCALGPSGTIDGRLFGRLDEDRLTALTQEWRS